MSTNNPLQLKIFFVFDSSIILPSKLNNAEWNSVVILCRKEWKNDSFRFIENEVGLYKGYPLQTQSKDLPGGTRMYFGKAVHDEENYGLTGLRIAYFDLWNDFNYRYTIEGKEGYVKRPPTTSWGGVHAWGKIHGIVKIIKYPSIPPASTSVEF